MREYDLQEMKREEMEEVNGGTSQVGDYSDGGLWNSVVKIVNNIKEFFTR